MMVLINSANPIRDPKKTTSRKSMMPLVIDVKWVRKLIAEIVSTRKSGAHPWKKFRTNGNPLVKNRKHTTADTINAMTWLLVVAEMHDQIARKPPAMKNVPT